MVAAALLAPVPLARAQAGPIPSAVRQRVLQLGEGRGPEAYALLRELWQRWELVDPVHVEQALAAVSSDDSVEPAVQSYASTLRAYARRRRGDLAGAKRSIRALGFVGQWLVVGPFDNENKSGLDEGFVPEQELAEPVLLDRSFVGKAQPVRWRSAGQAHEYGWLDFGALMHPRPYLCGYATTFLRAAPTTGRARKASLWVGASGAFKLFWNDRLVLRDGGYRQLDSDRVAAAVTLHPGFNRLTVKACGDENPPTIAVRVAEPDGSPARGIEVATSLAAGTAAAGWLRRHGSGGTHGAAAGPPEPRTGSSPPAGPDLWTAPSALPRVAGPLQRFEAARRARPDEPGLMAEFARYLAATGGDAAASHQARDLARRAAEAEPTVDRLLLAGKLAEDRNQRRRWVEAARSKARSPEERVDALLAAARLARTGAHWQDAVPLYDEVLEIEPGNVPAILGKVDLYVEAGLMRTALATLRRAALAEPKSVALLRAMAEQLRALGRDTEAEEVEARYAALRFDDAGYLERQVLLAVARGDERTARHWASRLLASEPASVWASAVVARALRALGDTPGAVRAYQQALVLAPEHAATLRALADLRGELGQRSAQVQLLQRLLRAHPQDKSARAYLEHIQPQRTSEDEKYAWPSDRFLALRAKPDRTHLRRTLRKLTVSTLMPNGLATHFHQVVFQPLTDEAAAASRQFAFPYHADRQIVQIRAAKVYRKDGRIDEAIEQGSTNVDDPALRMYTLQRAYYVQFPRLEVGDVVELRYRIEDVAAPDELAGAFGEIEYLQASEPISSAEYVLIAPKTLRLHTSASAHVKLRRQVRDHGSRRIYRYSADDVPAVRAEPHMPPWPEVLAHVHVSTFGSWQAVGRWYWGLVRDRLDVDDEVRRQARKLAQGLQGAREKVAAIYHHASSESRYVALEFGVEGIRPRRAALTLARGWGDCKDKAALIISMLRELGIEANLVLVRSGLRGRIPTATASLAPFDHAIVYVPSLDLYLDGTAEDTGSAELPAADRGALGLRIEQGRGVLVQLPEPAAAKSIERRQIRLELRADSELFFRAELSNQGVGAPAWRRRYQAGSTRRERLSSDLSAVLGPVELGPRAADLRVDNLERLEAPVRVLAKGTAQATSRGGTVQVTMGPSYRLGAEYAGLPRREHDIVLGPSRTREDVWTLSLHQGLEVVSAPKSVQVKSPFGSFSLEVEQTAARVVVRSVLRLDRGRVRAARYAELRAFLEAIDAASGAQLSVKPRPR